MICSTSSRISACLAVALFAGAASAQCNPAELLSGANSFPVGELPLSVGAGDVTGDNIPDLVTANFFGNTATLLVGKGDGTFAQGIELRMVPEGSKDTVGPVQVAIGDLNDDGANDIVIGANGSVGVLVNDGKGNFTGPPTFYGFASQVRGVVIASLNSSVDNIPDIVFSCRDTNNLYVLLGNGDGTFVEHVPSTIFGGLAGAVVRDYNNDGFLDVASPLVFSSEVVIAYGDGAGNFTESHRLAAPSPEWLDGGDVNGDGIPDLASANFNGNAIHVHIGNGDGQFQSAITVSTGADSMPITVALADLNGDGFDDILAPNFTTSSTQVYLSNGDGTFQDMVSFDSGRSTRRVVTSDLNTDGALDVIAANGSVVGTVTVLLNQCVGTPPCATDWNADSVVNSQDFFDFLTSFFDNKADFNQDKVTNSQDFFDFLTAFFDGC